MDERITIYANVQDERLTVISPTPKDGYVPIEVHQGFMQEDFIYERYRYVDGQLGEVPFDIPVQIPMP